MAKNLSNIAHSKALKSNELQNRSELKKTEILVNAFVIYLLFKAVKTSCIFEHFFNEK